MSSASRQFGPDTTNREESHHEPQHRPRRRQGCVTRRPGGQLRRGATQDSPRRHVGHYDTYATAAVGDDNAHGRIDEDESGFDCRVMGNLRCGPGALLPDGSLAAPGDYSDPNCWPGAIYCPQERPQSTL
jgi:hypothetical protein